MGFARLILMRPWYRDTRKTALIACAASIIAIVIEFPAVERATRALPSSWLIIPMAVLIGPLGLSLPLFYFALYRSERTQPLSQRLQWLCVAGIIVFIADATTNLPWARSFGAGPDASVLVAPEPWTIRRLLPFLPGILNLACVLPLIGLYASRSFAADLQVSMPKPLKVTAMTAAIAWGVVALLSALRLILTPILYSDFVRMAQQIGRTPPSVKELSAEPLRMLLSGFELAVAPYVVWRSGTRPAAPTSL